MKLSSLAVVGPTGPCRLVTHDLRQKIALNVCRCSSVGAHRTRNLDGYLCGGGQKPSHGKLCAARAYVQRGRKLNKTLTRIIYAVYENRDCQRETLPFTALTCFFFSDQSHTCHRSLLIAY